MRFTVNALSEALGAEITGIDLTRPLHEKEIGAIHQAWLDHLVVVVRDQRIIADDQMRFCRYFGEIGRRSRPPASRHETTMADAPSEVMYVSNRKKNGRYTGSLPEGEMQFHIDQCYTREPAAATALYAVEVPSRGGDTLFANLYSAYASLPDRLKRAVEGRWALNVYQYGQTQRGDRIDRDNTPHFVHPMVRRHPESGRAALWINRLMTRQIEGLPPDESERLLSELFAWQERPEFIYRHQWRVGDLLLWDNRCVTHARTDFDSSQPRHLVRFTLKGDQPVAASA